MCVTAVLLCKIKKKKKKKNNDNNNLLHSVI